MIHGPPCYPDQIFMDPKKDDERIAALEKSLNEAREIIRECHPAIDPALVRPTEPSLFYRIGKFLAKTE